MTMVGAFALKVAYKTHLLSKKDEWACDCWVSGESNVDTLGACSGTIACWVGRLVWVFAGGVDD